MNPDNTSTSTGHNGQNQTGNDQSQTHELAPVVQPPQVDLQQVVLQLQASMAAMQNQLQQIQQQQQGLAVVAPVVAAPAQAEIPAAVPEAGGQRLEPVYERFRKQSPPTFDGGADPTEAEQWMDMIKIVLDFMGLVGNDRVRCATYTFRKDARTWWNVITQTRDIADMTWEEFVRLFNEKYYNEAVRQTKAEEFITLTQGDMSVTEYTMKFDRLSNFAHSMVPTDEIRKERFIAGLKARIAHDVSISLPQGTSTYAQVVERALVAERFGARIRKEDAALRDLKKPVPPVASSGKSGSPEDFKRKSSDSAQRSSPNKKS